MVLGLGHVQKTEIFDNSPWRGRDHMARGSLGPKPRRRRTHSSLSSSHSIFTCRSHALAR